ncbi:restriction endonuclease subunit S [Gluconobacter vitians]|nr:restriction endonuclease subunit S [Gluconobacter vitians]
MLPQGWVEATINDLGDYLNGMAFKPSDWEDQGTGIIRIQNLTNPKKPLNRTRRNFDEKYLVRRDDILVSWSATLDVFFWDREDAVLNQHIFKAIPSSVVDKRFLFIALKKAIYEMMKSEHLHGSTMKHINRGPFLAHKVWLPPLAEQRRIVAKLDSLTARIARARAELERVRVLSFRAWKSAINQSFQKLKCENVPLKQIAQITGGLTKNAKRRSLPLQVPYLRVANVYANELRLSDVARIGCSEKEYKKTKLEKNDILIVEGNGSIDQVGRAALWDGEIGGCTHQNHLIRIRPSESISSEFLLLFLESSLGRKYIETSASSTSGLHTLSISKVGNFSCPLPSRLLQDATVKYLNLCRDRLLAKRIEIDRALTLLDRLEFSLLAKAFRGELVTQDPNDEPASVLLDRIRAERAADTKPGRKRRA